LKESIDCERLAQSLGEEDLNKVYLPHNEDCEKFYQCGIGGANEFHCGDGLNFNIRQKQCGHAENTKCVLLTDFLAKRNILLSSFYYSDY
jgi:hypothetical protein